ncbi:MAG: recombination regulator RecX [Chloroflexota bacterium]|nr:recombination regulator RecX [Chloroflexota bacterium]
MRLQSMTNPETISQTTGATVLSVAPVDQKGQEFAVTFDGSAPLRLTVAVVVEFGIRPGRVFQAGDLDALRHADVRQRATEAAVRYLGMRPRSTHEIRDYLHRKGYSPETVETAVGGLTERGYLDDLAFARWWAENRAQFQPRGPYLIRQELRRKGVTSATIDETLAEQAETVDTDAQALALARTKLRSFHKNSLEPDVITRRLSGLLARRGYGYDIVRTVLKTLRDNGELDAASTIDVPDDE